MVLEVNRDDDVLELMLNRPESLNAFTVELHEQLARGLDAARDPAVRAVLITGAGKAFCAGQDLGELDGLGITVGELLQRHYNPNIWAIRELDKPVVAAVGGVAAGAGVGLALACDVRIASEKASLVPAFVAIGLVPDSGLSWTATRILGEARAFDWLTSNRKLTAADALDWGLVTAVVAADKLLSSARRRARELAAIPGEAAGSTKRLLREASTSTLGEQLDREARLQQAASEHPASSERIAAFIRRP